MQTAKQEFKAAYSAARKAVAGQHVHATRVPNDRGGYFFDVVSAQDFSAVHFPGALGGPGLIIQVIAMKHAPAAFPELADRLAKHKKTEAWLAGDVEADDDYIDD